MIQNVLFAISFIFFRLMQMLHCTRNPIFNYATNAWAPFLKARLLITTDCVTIQDNKLYSLHNSDTQVHANTSSFNP